MGLEQEVDRMCAAETLNEQREIWQRSIRKILLSRLLAWTVIGNEKWLWKALGVPPNQRNMIEEDYAKLNGEEQSSKRQGSHTSSNGALASGLMSGHAIWQYAVNTLDPVVNNTLLSNDNHYYMVCLKGHYTRRSHPDYLTPKAHIKLSKSSPSTPSSPLSSPFSSPTTSPRPEHHHNPSPLGPSPIPAPSPRSTSTAFNGLRIHTDEMNEVLARMAPATLTIAVVMDSMDWFDPNASPAAADPATAQIRALNRALRARGRVLLRSASLQPWYVAVFERNGFAARRVGARWPGECIDRVNMYASTWICTKVAEVVADDGEGELSKCVDGLGRPMERLDI